LSTFACGKPVPLPRPRLFRDPILQILGRITSYQANAPVSHNRVSRLVMAEIGYDPDNLPVGWRERGVNQQIRGLDQIRVAARSLRADQVPTVVQPQRGLWALTPAGVVAACALDGVSEPPQEARDTSKPQSPNQPPNETSRWLEEHLAGGVTSELYLKMYSYMAKRLPVSACSGQIDDHIQTFLLRFINRNGLRKILQKGDMVPYSKVCSWAVNSGRSDARDYGSEPVCRTLYHARTERERLDADADDVVDPNVGLGGPHILDSDKNIVTPINMMPDYDMNENLDFKSLWTKIEAIVHKEKPGAWERYAGILAMKTRGFTTHEIAEAEGVSRNRAAGMLAEARRCVRVGYDRGDLEGLVALKV